MINKEGKLFGIINVVDLLIIVGIIGAAFFISKKFMNKKVVVTNTKPVIMKLYSEEMPSFVASVMKIGDRLEDETKNLYLGKITEINLGEGYMYVPNSQGELKKAIKENYNSVEITGELNAQIFDNGIIIEGNKYSVGNGFVVRTGKSKWYFRISALEY